MPDKPRERFLYLFLDEAGNLDFSRNGTKYFVLGGITKERPFHAYKELTERKRAAVEKGVKMTLAAMLTPSVRYRVLHHASKSNMDLQIADYCTWAIYRKWNGNDDRSFLRVQAAVRREWDVLQAGTGFPD